MLIFPIFILSFNALFDRPVMKKISLIVLIVLSVIIVAVYLLLPRIAVSMVTNYEPWTFEKVLDNPEIRKDYGINDCSSPEDYGFKSEEINYTSLDGTKLNGWFIPTNSTSGKCIVFIHGRTSNRLKPMKFLALIDSLDLDTIYNIFIPDMRNSGKSQDAKTHMGYNFSEDVIASILLMKNTYQQDTFLLYGFSMGAMATLKATSKADLAEKYEGNNIVIEKVILDSPLSNVKETLRGESASILITESRFNKMFDLYSEEINGFGEQMKMSALLNPDIPFLIIQSKDDKTTKMSTLEFELNNMGKFTNFELVLFEGPDHVRIFQDDRTRVAYIDAVQNFLVENP